MALIKCPECSKEVSNKAPSCPHCGTPIAAASDQTETGVVLTTVQETSKKLKIHILISACLFWGGLILIFTAIGSVRAIGTLIMFIGMIWYLITRFNIWWHHK